MRRRRPRDAHKTTVRRIRKELFGGVFKRFYLNGPEGQGQDPGKLRSQLHSPVVTLYFSPRRYEAAFLECGDASPLLLAATGRGESGR